MSVQLTGKYNPANPNHVYYDIQTINANDNDDKVPLIFSETRSTAFLTAPANYYLSVVRFEISTQSLPVLIPKIAAVGTNTTTYELTLTFQTNTVTKTLIYIPTDTTVPPPSLGDGINSNTYYHMYNIKDFLDMMNVALEDAYSVIFAAVGSPTNDNWEPPKFLYDEVSQLFSLEGPSYLLGQNIVGDYLKVYMNADLYNIVPFPMATYKKTFGAGENNYLLNVKTSNSSLGVITLYQDDGTLIKNYNTVKLTQDFSSVPLMNPVESIVFTSLKLPILPGLAGPNLVYGSNNVPAGEINNSNNFTNIITDFIVPYAAGNNYKNIITYEPTVYRLIDMVGLDDLKDIDIQCYWRDRYGNLNRFYMTNGAFASIKIMFRDKSLGV